ncbi:MAG: NAD-dependent epimerase/dehydratase family protein [Candidatus Hydrogenedens sp.]|nr:NAD-dependent epimerase/dehydratase family protein [Candidatus Hydrogenedens sp.]
MSRILVTGGAGFIGSHIVDAYIEAGHEVMVLDNFHAGVRENLNAAAALVELDIRSPELEVVMREFRPEVVNHLAAQIDVRLSVEDPMFDADVNIIGGINLLENCIKVETRKFIFASTGGAIYGEPKTLPADEQTEPNPKCHYATSKLGFEHYIKLYKALYGMNYTILRYPNVYGPRQRPDGEAGVCSILTGIMLQGKTPTLYGHGTPLRDYVYAGDIARANVLALDHGDGTCVNTGSGRGVSVRELFDTLKDIIGFEGEPDLQPLRPGEIDQIYITGDRAKEVLGWEPQVSLREGLARTVAHIRSAAA